MRHTKRAAAVLFALDVERWRYVSEVAIRASLDPSGVSTTLRALMGEGLVEAEDEAREETDFGKDMGATHNRGRRRYYRLTPAGAQVAARWRECVDG
jgi:DNA-binding PadR family transcriptional regulator